MAVKKSSAKATFLLLAGVALACNLSLRSASPRASETVAGPSGENATEAETAASPAAEPSSSATDIPPENVWPPTVDEVLAECPTAGEIAEVESRIHLRFDADPTAGALACTAAAGSADLTRQQKNAYNAVLIMKELEFDAPLPWTDQSLYDWFTGSVQFIEFRSDIAGHHCCGSPPTISIRAELHIHHSDRWTAVGNLMRLYVHEARHRYMAHRCDGKDNSIGELGSYGVEARLYEWLAYHSDPDFLTMLAPGPTSDYREDARMAFYSIQQNMFCLDPTPAGPPPTLAASPLAGTAVYTERMIQALQSGIPSPVLLEPAADAAVPNEGVVFTWQAVEYPGGVTYGIEIDELFRFGTESEFWKAREDAAGLNAARYAMSLGFSGEYTKLARWRVWAISPTAGPGPKSEWRYFRIGK